MKLSSKILSFTPAKIDFRPDIRGGLVKFFLGEWRDGLVKILLGVGWEGEGCLVEISEFISNLSRIF